MYEYLLENLINPYQVESNLNRTADKGLISELYRKQLNKLALKYFGVDSNGNYTDKLEDIVAYKCPYSGEIITDTSQIHLEHILPVSSNGGTVIFNCIPISEYANISKHDRHLIEWLHWKGYFDYKNLDRIVNYIFEAYDLYISGSVEEDLYDTQVISSENSTIQNDDLSINELQQLNESKNLDNITYYQLLLDIINELSSYEDVSKYNIKIQSLEEQRVFGEIKEIEKLIWIVQSSFKEVLGDDNVSYLSYSLRINMKKLLNSLKTDRFKDEINQRLEFIKATIEQNNISINDYFDSLLDIEDINPIYFDINDMTEQIKNSFIANVSIGTNTKILMLIDMIKHAKTPEEIEELLKHNSSRRFTTYKQNENGKWVVDKEYETIKEFYGRYKSKIQPEIEKLTEVDLEFRDKLDEYYMTTLGGQRTEEGEKRRLEVFIDMIKHAKTSEEIEELFMTRTKKKFTTYKQNADGEWIVDKEYGTLVGYFSANRSKIQPEIEKLLKTDLEFRDKLDEYYMNTQGGKVTVEGLKRRQEIFIDMIKHSKSVDDLEELFNSRGDKNFTTYKQTESGEWVVDKEYAPLLKFWGIHKSKLQPEIEKLAETDLELRDKLDEYYMNTLSGQHTEEGLKRRQEIFIDMIKHTKTPEEIEELLKYNSSRKFTTYKQNGDGEWVVDKEYGPLQTYWAGNKSKIQLEIEKDLELRDKLDEYYINTLGGQRSDEGAKRRLEIFIDMIKHSESADDLEKLFNPRSGKNFTTYKQTESGEWVVDKEYGPLQTYWAANKSKIQPVIEKFAKTDLELRNKLDEYYINTRSGQQSVDGIKRRFEIFIDMIKHAKTPKEIEGLFITSNNKNFTTYKQDNNGEWIVDKEYGPLSTYWSRNKEKIQPEIEKLSETDLELRDKLDEYYMNTPSGQKTKEGIARRVKVFVDMIRQTENLDELGMLFNKSITKKFTTYKQTESGEWVVDKEYGTLEYYWSNQKIKAIIPSLFFSKEYESSDYDDARDKVMNYINHLQIRHKLPEFKNIYEYILTLDASKKEVKDLIKVRDEYLAKRDALIEENERLKQDNGARRIA